MGDKDVFSRSLGTRIEPLRCSIVASYGNSSVFWDVLPAMLSTGYLVNHGNAVIDGTTLGAACVRLLATPEHSSGRFWLL